MQRQSEKIDKIEKEITQNKLDEITKENENNKALFKTIQDSLKNEIKKLTNDINIEGEKTEQLYNDLYEKNDFIQNSLYGKGLAYITPGPIIVDSEGSPGNSIN